MVLDDIAVYLQIVASKSLSRAAKAMNRPKASVSHQLKRLEDELGTQLFQRTANQMTLNAAGRDFYDHAVSIRHACERALDSAQASRTAAGSKITIASSSEFASNLISPVLMHFSKHHADLQINAMNFPRNVLPEVREQYDCILYLGNPPTPQFSNMTGRLLGRFEFGLYASPTYLARHGEPLEPKGLLSLDLLGFLEGHDAAPWLLTNGSGEFKIKPQTRLLSNDYWVIKLSALHDHGICFLPTFFAGQEAEAGLLQRILPNWASPEIPVYALFWSHRFANPNLRALIDSLTQNFDEMHSYLYTATRKETLQPGSPITRD